MDRCVYFGFTDYCSDEFAEVVSLGEVDWREAYAGCVLEAIGLHVTDHDDCSAKDLSGGCGSEATGPAPGM